MPAPLPSSRKLQAELRHPDDVRADDRLRSLPLEMAIGAASAPLFAPLGAVGGAGHFIDVVNSRTNRDYITRTMKETGKRPPEGVATTFNAFSGDTMRDLAVLGHAGAVGGGLLGHVLGKKKGMWGGAGLGLLAGGAVAGVLGKRRAERRREHLESVFTKYLGE